MLARFFQLDVRYIVQDAALPLYRDDVRTLRAETRVVFRTPLPAIGILRDLSENLNPDVLRHTMWDAGVRLTRDPSGTPIKASDVTIGSAFHVIPEGLNEAEHKLEEKAKAVVLLMRLDPESVNVSPEKADWNVDGIFAYSKVCTHVGCPVALYEQQTHHLLCPCHQSTFDMTDDCKVIFGPAKRPLPQLPITVDDEGYLVAEDGFREPIGPSFFERERPGLLVENPEALEDEL